MASLPRAHGRLRQTLPGALCKGRPFCVSAGLARRFASLQTATR